jgi:hypothetical protein
MMSTAHTDGEFISKIKKGDEKVCSAGSANSALTTAGLHERDHDEKNGRS